MEKIILTGNYQNCKMGNIVSISGDRGKSVGFCGEVLSYFAPKMSFWKVWHNNIGKIPEDENNRYYIHEFYHQVLKPLDPETMLERLKDNTIFLCYEDNIDFCHRHLVAFWFELFLGMKTSEVMVEEQEKRLIEIERPNYLKGILEEVIKEDYEMHGFNSIRAAYLSNQADLLEKENWADLKSHPGKINDIPELWGWEVASLRIQATEEEEKYQIQQKASQKLVKSIETSRKAINK